MRPGIDPNDCDENYEWFTVNELKNIYGRTHAFLVAGNSNVPSRLRACTGALEYGILKKVYAMMIKYEVRNAKDKLSRAKGTNDAQE